jgi:succinate-semialdehyde dehydrogenase/glutarate-semialdehyde dehydrogenase/succinyl-CoA reductase
MPIKTINPATEEIIKEYQVITEDELKNKITKSREAFSKWKVDPKKRSTFLHILSEELRKNKEYLAKIATQEMGKPLKESLAEVE